MYYQFEMKNARGTTCAIVRDPVFSNGILKAILVAEFNGYAADGSFKFKSCKEREFIAGGGPYTLTEIKV